MRKAILFFVSVSMIAVPSVADDCGWFMFAVGTYGDNSEISGMLSFCSPGGSVTGCSIKADCYDGRAYPAATLAPGTAAPSNEWAGLGPCEAVTHAKTFVCPFNINSAPEPFTPVSSGPDTKNP